MAKATQDVSASRVTGNATRRAFIAAGAGAMASIATLSAVAEGGKHLSTEFIQWEDLALAYMAFFDETNPAYHNGVDDANVAAEHDRYIVPIYDRMHVLEAAIYRRAARSQIEILEMGVVANFWNNDDRVDPLTGPIEPGEYPSEKSAGALIRAIGIIAKSTGLFRCLDKADFDLVLPEMPNEANDV